MNCLILHSSVGTTAFFTLEEKGGEQKNSSLATFFIKEFDFGGNGMNKLVNPNWQDI